MVSGPRNEWRGLQGSEAVEAGCVAGWSAVGTSPVGGTCLTTGGQGGWGWSVSSLMRSHKISVRRKRQPDPAVGTAADRPGRRWYGGVHERRRGLAWTD
jgi:hypothetical protein